MRTGTNTSIYFKALDDTNIMDEPEVIRRLHEVGFEAIDFSLFSVSSPSYILNGDDWQKKVDRVAETAAKYGMIFSQIHLPFICGGNRVQHPSFTDPGYAKHFDESMRRAYIAASMVGAPWAVAHCYNYPMETYDREESKKGNHEYYDDYVELGMKHGVGTAFENMIQGTKESLRLRYTGHYSELIEFVDSYQDPMVKICWDTGHANEACCNQAYALRKIGKRLACLHVNDNYRDKDHHNIPFCGTVDWRSVISALAEIGYTGDCSLEAGKFVERAPRALQDSFVRTAYEACRYLCDMFEQLQNDNCLT